MKLLVFFSQKHRRCLGSRLGDYGRSERECPDPVDGRWTGCGRAGAAEIAWEEARDGGARANVRIRWTGGGRAVDGRELQKYLLLYSGCSGCSFCLLAGRQCC